MNHGLRAMELPLHLESQFPMSVLTALVFFHQTEKHKGSLKPHLFDSFRFDYNKSFNHKEARRSSTTMPFSNGVTKQRGKLSEYSWKDALGGGDDERLAEEERGTEMVKSDYEETEQERCRRR
ncbi:hypothetical protein Bca52824_019342 [Brassica carinata]|uniref:Uncharacterized protein n=1 Tax=Brassica carinata TaxID=52824 RepID=A0A8X7VRV9_BRACI|nr:hypothetical protein Bca52824_019342 [Brassica carinata]